MYPSSRYRYVLGYQEGNYTFLDEREPVAYSEQPDNRYHRVKEGDTWWGLAHRYFDGFPRKCGLWWILVDFQPDPIVDPTIALIPGQILVIPSARFVRDEVFSSKRRRYQ